MQQKGRIFVKVEESQIVEVRKPLNMEEGLKRVHWCYNREGVIKKLLLWGRRVKVQI